MKLSTKGKYSMYAMIYLAEHEAETPLPLTAMTQTGVQPDYLEQLLASLRKAGLVTTVRGAHGGYALARPAESISVGEIIRATEGPVSMAGCTDDSRSCLSGETCPTRRAWDYLSGRINQLMDAISLRDVVTGEVNGGCRMNEQATNNINHQEAP